MKMGTFCNAAFGLMFFLRIFAKNCGFWSQLFRPPQRCCSVGGLEPERKPFPERYKLAQPLPSSIRWQSEKIFNIFNSDLFQNKSEISAESNFLRLLPLKVVFERQGKNEKFHRNVSRILMVFKSKFVPCTNAQIGILLAFPLPKTCPLSFKNK